jgi:hypothetical protein
MGRMPGALGAGVGRAVGDAAPLEGVPDGDVDVAMRARPPVAPMTAIATTAPAAAAANKLAIDPHAIRGLTGSTDERGKR